MFSARIVHKLKVNGLFMAVCHCIYPEVGARNDQHGAMYQTPLYVGSKFCRAGPMSMYYVANS